MLSWPGYLPITLPSKDLNPLPQSSSDIAEVRLRYRYRGRRIRIGSLFAHQHELAAATL